MNEMRTFSLRLEFHIPRPFISSSSISNTQLSVEPIKISSYRKQLKNPATSTAPPKTAITLREHHRPRPTSIDKHLNVELGPRSQNPSTKLVIPENGYSRVVIVGAVSVGILLFLFGIDEQKALAFGPGGPLVEEFWDNVRRYALYALTVSTGALYTIFQPIFELLRNPISAILILAILGGSIYIVAQVVSAMVGVTDFTYDYAY
ncbi:hypothetical protein L6164_036022 [Bauhinia variegata]|uniref:Uncharacterized protein n=1 Tax=Bauhinia variegata TaxID=167791 RepID=A0ACB9KFQ9_BAUVA|nr:hypothetical protein L6164_036022 [Bauhinia variegata]